MQTLSIRPSVSVGHGYTDYLFVSTPVRNLRDLLISLPEKGLDRLTNGKIEHIICTSALAAFN